MRISEMSSPISLAHPSPATVNAPKTELGSGLRLFEPEVLSCPLVFCSPHSGNCYPRQFLAESRLNALALRRSEDAHVDKLFSFAPDIGAPLLTALFPRAYLDVNREPYELDPRMFEGRLPAYANTRSLRVAGGLGTIARIVGEGQEIYSRRLQVSEGLERIETLYKPFHAQLQQRLMASRQAMGHYVLVDCHSMPASASLGESQGRLANEPARADFVIGDRFGTSCHPDIVDVVEYELTRLGYGVVRNKPYAGGFITENYGNPALARHAVQIEINRALYMNERTLEPNPHFDRLAADLREMSQTLALWCASALGPARLAAE